MVFYRRFKYVLVCVWIWCRLIQARTGCAKISLLSTSQGLIKLFTWPCWLCTWCNIQQGSPTNPGTFRSSSQHGVSTLFGYIQITSLAISFWPCLLIIMAQTALPISIILVLTVALDTSISTGDYHTIIQFSLVIVAPLPTVIRQHNIIA